MGNIERHFKQGEYFCHLLVLDRYMFEKNILFVYACTHCFLKEKLLVNKSFYTKNGKMAGKDLLMLSYFLIVTIWIKMKILEKLHTYKENK